MSFNLSSSPHVRGSVSTHSIMWDVSLALLPTTAFGVYRFGYHALAIVLVSVLFAVLSEYAFMNIRGQKVLISDGSAFLTGLMIALNMPPRVPLWIPALGSIFAIIFVKQLFGGLGQNFMNPAMGARCFLLISFTSIMSDFKVDSVTSATPVARLASGESVDLYDLFIGNTVGTIGEVSAICILIGGIYLLAKKIITWEIPVCYIGSFAIFMFFLGHQTFNMTYVLAEICAGGLMLGAWFMATDYVTSPVTKNGKILFGVFLGILTGIFRVHGVSAEGVSYAIIIGNLLVPLIEKITMPKAFGLEHVKKEKKAKEKTAEESAPAVKAPISMKAYHAALNLCVITLVVGLLLGVVYQMTKEPIERAEMEEATAAFAAVCPQAASFEDGEDLMANAHLITDGTYGNVVLNSAYHSLDEDGAINGYVVNITTKDGFGGEITSAIGFDKDHLITGIEFLEINETAGLGMRATEPEFRAQYCGIATDSFVLVKSGKSAENEVDALSGASITSAAVTNSVNAALAVVNSAE